MTKCRAIGPKEQQVRDLKAGRTNITAPVRPVRIEKLRAMAAAVPPLKITPVASSLKDGDLITGIKGGPHVARFPKPTASAPANPQESPVDTTTETATDAPKPAKKAKPPRAKKASAPKKKGAKKAAKKATKKTGAKKRAAAKKVPAKAAKKTEGGLRPGSKLEIVAGLLTRSGGCTGAEILAACQWPTVSVPQQAKAAGLKLRKEKTKGEPTRYFGSAA